MSIPFDTGPTATFRTLCENYPDDTVYKGTDGFRAVWGPIFYRGRADGNARLLVIGQDPAQTEAVTRRILCGQAGKRVQGFVEKLGYTTHYLMINTFVYAIYNQSMALPHLHDAAIESYRNAWLAAALAHGKIDAVVTFGNPARDAWNAFVATPAGQAVTVFHQHAIHPTGDQGSISRKDLLDNWNVALTKLKPHVTHPDVVKALVPYGADFTPAELPEIPSHDLPPGIPAWMRSSDAFWAAMPASPNEGDQRANISITVP